MNYPHHDPYPGLHIQNQHDELIAWVQNYYNDYDAWYQHVRETISIDSGIPLFDFYSNYSKQECLDRIASLQNSIQEFSTYLHQWSYSIVSRQVRIDLLYHRICVISSDERMQEDREKSKKKVVINKDLSIERV